MKKNLSKFRILALDTNIFAYYFNRQSAFYLLSEQLFQSIEKNNLQMVTSILTVAELLSFEAPRPLLKDLEDTFFSIPKLLVQEVDRTIAQKAAEIRREYKYKLPDAVQLATALSAKAQIFITNDQRLKSFKELKVLSLKDI